MHALQVLRNLFHAACASGGYASVAQSLSARDKSFPEVSMADYLARVEVHATATDDDFRVLHSKMAHVKFFFIIMGGAQGTTGYKLPHGTYFCYGTYPDLNAAHVAVASAAAATGLSLSFLVCAVDGWRATGLALLE